MRRFVEFFSNSRERSEISQRRGINNRRWLFLLSFAKCKHACEEIRIRRLAMSLLLHFLSQYALLSLRRNSSRNAAVDAGREHSQPCPHACNT